MKKFLSTTLCLIIINFLYAQDVQLPIYQKDVYNQTTIFNYSGNFPLNGKGSIGLGSKITSPFISGMDITLIIDTIIVSDTSSHAGAFKMGSGTQKKLHTGDHLELPIEIWLFSAEIEFHIVIEGIPQTAGERYPCELDFAYTLGEDWGMSIVNTNDKECVVDNANLVASLSEEKRYVSIAPNPFNHSTSLKLIGFEKSLYEFNLFDVRGNLVKNITEIQPSSTVKIEKTGLSKGMYFFQLKDKTKVLEYGKLMIE